MCATGARCVRFSTTNYVLPRTGQRGIPIISVNTKAVAVEIYRVSDRNLIDTIEAPFGQTQFPAQSEPLRHRQPERHRRRLGLEGELAVDNRRSIRM